MTGGTTTISSTTTGHAPPHKNTKAALASYAQSAVIAPGANVNP